MTSMNIISAALLGIIEGLTEFLPISSTFHLIWTSRLLGIAQTDFQKAFEVIIQSGAILAVVVLYWPTLRTSRKLIIKLLYSFVPTAVVGLALYRVIKNVFFENAFIQLGVFVVVGIFFILFETFQRQKLRRTIGELTVSHAIAIGLVQALAVIPGVSRAGAVILGLMILGVKRDEAATYSFLLAIPTLGAAAGLDAIKTAPFLFSDVSAMKVLLVGFFAAFLSAIIAVKWFISFLQSHTLSSFGFYRLALGALLIFLFFFQR